MKRVFFRGILLLLFVVACNGSGLLIKPLIFGGITALDATEFPYQVSLQRSNAHICGGSIISRNYVLTAAHCVTVDDSNSNIIIDASLLSVRVGSTLKNTGGLVISVSNVRIHSNYFFPANDIALLKLKTSLSYTTQIQAIKLPTSGITPNTVIVASGWGFTSTSGTLPNALQHVDLTSTSTKDCTKIYGSVPSSIFCAKSAEGKGICQGDSGGPGVYDDRLYGVASFTPDTCGSQYPDGFTNVFNFLDWIIQYSDVL